MLPYANCLIAKVQLMWYFLSIFEFIIHSGSMFLSQVQFGKQSQHFGPCYTLMRKLDELSDILLFLIVRSIMSLAQKKK